MSNQKEKQKCIAIANIAKLTDAAMKLIREAEEIAKVNEVSFKFDITYGMGGVFHGAGYNSDYGYAVGWAASSQGC